ncbi:MAG: hypothetical protein Crog4KO_34870 [Crocinitomicaceae bacterium]
MDLKQLEAFLALVDHDKMQDAAQALGLSQPSTSFRLQQLEKALGYNLFNRNNRTLALTDEGRALIPYARQILSLRQEASLAVQTAQKTSNKTLQLLVTDTALLAYTQFILESLDKTPDYLQIDLIRPDELEARLKYMPQSIVFTTYNPQLDDINLYLEHRISYYAVCHSKHLLNQSNQLLTLTDLRPYPFVHVNDLNGILQQATTLVSASLPAISLPQYLVAQDAITILPRYLAQLYSRPTFSHLDLDADSFNFPTLSCYILTSQQLAYSAYQTYFLDAVQKNLLSL